MHFKRATYPLLSLCHVSPNTLFPQTTLPSHDLQCHLVRPTVGWTGCSIHRPTEIQSARHPFSVCTPDPNSTQENCRLKGELGCKSSLAFVLLRRLKVNIPHICTHRSQRCWLWEDRAFSV